MEKIKLDGNNECYIDVCADNISEEFSCNKKCRLCPYPGANCAKIELDIRRQENAKGDKNKL